MEAPNKKPRSTLSASRAEQTDAELRERAERAADQAFPLSPLPLETMSLEAVRQALHELQVHQIELEMQNEELQRAQVQLDKAKSRYFDLYDMAPVGYCTVNPAGVVKEANIAAATLLGTTRSQLVGKWLSHYVTKPHQDRFYLHRKQAVVYEEQQVCELQMVKTDGSLCWVAMTTTMALEDDGSCLHRVVLHDITDAKTLFGALEESEKKFRSLLESSPDATVIVDQQGTMVLVNARTQEIFGYSRVELIGKKVELLLPTRLRQQHVGHRGGFMARPIDRDSRVDFELLGMRKDQSEFLIEVSLSPLQTKGGLLTSCSIRDITERKHLTDLLSEKNVELETAKHVAEKANLAKSDFLSSMSHELRTPLSAILGFTQLIDAGTPPPTALQKRSIDQILQAGWYLLALINEVLDLALVESGKLSMALQAMALEDVMRECLTMIEPQADKRGITVTIKACSEPHFVMADGKRVKQILINLLSNAIKYNRPNGVVRVSCAKVETGYVRISVEDTGEGLPPEKIAHLFQPFNRLGQENLTEQGTGVGLVMTKRLVELMGGAIGVESRVGTGSTFWIDMVLTNEPLPAPSPGLMPTATLAKPGSRTHTLLYVEDNLANLLLMESLMEHRPDIDLLTAKNGADGIATAKSSLPDVILMDINLPGISGMEVLKTLLDDPATAHIPVVALSANAIPADIEKGMATGFYRYLTKPINISALMATLDETLTLAATRSSLVAKSAGPAEQRSSA